jgi:hypothetical protein
MSFTDGAHRVRAGWLGAAVLLVATGTVHFADASTPAADATVTVPLAPVRILDTRSGIGAPAAPLGAGQSLDLQVTGVAGVPLGAVGVLLNITADGATETTYLTAWPAGADRPEASVLNAVPGQALPNFIEAKLGADGKLSIYNFAGSVNVIADVSGYQVPVSAVTGLPGGAGPAGPQGAQGPQGVSAWETIPGGVTVTGTDTWIFPTTVAGQTVGAGVNLPAGVAVPLTSATIGQQASSAALNSDEDAACTGNGTNPTAPPGKLCVYATGYANIPNSLNTYPQGSFGAFSLAWTTSTASFTSLTIVWAYTAPI